MVVIGVRLQGWSSEFWPNREAPDSAIDFSIHQTSHRNPYEKTVLFSCASQPDLFYKMPILDCPVLYSTPYRCFLLNKVLTLLQSHLTSISDSISPMVHRSSSSACRYEKYPWFRGRQSPYDGRSDDIDEPWAGANGWPWPSWSIFVACSCM